MKSKTRFWPTIVVALAATAAIAATAAPVHHQDTQSSEPRLCCVANPRFSGICSVELGPDETCQAVLDYLNNANSVGKTYCGKTNIRGGWAQVECQDENASTDGGPLKVP